MNYLRSSMNIISCVTQHVKFFEKEIQKQAPQVTSRESKVKQVVTSSMSNFEKRESNVARRLNPASYVPLKAQEERSQVARRVRFFENAIAQHQNLQEANQVKRHEEETNSTYFALRQAGYLPLESSHSNLLTEQVIIKIVPPPVQSPVETTSYPSQETEKVEMDSSQILIASNERAPHETPIIDWNEIRWQANLLHYEEGRLTKSMMQNPAFKRYAKIRLPVDQILFEKLKFSEESRKLNPEEKALSQSHISDSLEDNLGGSCLINESQENQELAYVYQEPENWETAILAMERGEYVPDIGMTEVFKRGIRTRLPIPSFV